MSTLSCNCITGINVRCEFVHVDHEVVMRKWEQLSS